MVRREHPVIPVPVPPGRWDQSQLRDVALAATIYRTGQDPREFGFEYAKPDPNTLYSPSTLGFKNEEERAQAVQKWSDFATERADGAESP